MITRNPKRHPTLVDHVVQQLFQAIISGQLKPGQRLTEDQLAADFGVSRTPVREAVKRLSELGVVVVHPRARLEVAAPTSEDIRQIAELRCRLEVFAAELALPRLTEDDLAELEAIQSRCLELARGDNRIDVFREDSRFHLRLAELSGNRYLRETLERLDVKVQLCRSFSCVKLPKIRKDIQKHNEIIASLRRRDLQATRDLLGEHLQPAVWTPQGA